MEWGTVAFGGPDIQIETDASTSGWGTECMGKEATGIWSTELQFMPSNYGEVIVAHMVLFKDMIQGKVVQILTDNIIMVAYPNHLGGHCLTLSDLAQATQCTAHFMNVPVRAKHLAGSVMLTISVSCQLSLSSW